MVLPWVGNAGHERIIETVEDRLRREERETDHGKPEAGDGPTKDHGRVGKANRYGVLFALILACALLLTVAPVSWGQSTDEGAAQRPPDERSGDEQPTATPGSADLLRKAEREGVVRVIVGPTDRLRSRRTAGAGPRPPISEQLSKARKRGCKGRVNAEATPQYARAKMAVLPGFPETRSSPS